MERTYFLDNLRSLMIIIIVIFHSALSYTTDIVPWWYVTDRNDHQLFDVFILILDYFQLPVLFLIAGFFSISSIEKHGTKAFIITKIRKLIIPLVLLSILYTPVMLFIRYALNTKNPVGYVDYLSSYLPTLSDAGIVVLNQATALKQANSFSVVHLWFISVLFIFFCITGTAYKFFKNKEQSSARTVKPYFPAFIIGGFSISLLIAVITPGFF
jgi:surface polysaccharide O-acyltransferase-like enzyme